MKNFIMKLWHPFSGCNSYPGLYSHALVWALAPVAARGPRPSRPARPGCGRLQQDCPVCVSWENPVLAWITSNIQISPPIIYIERLLQSKSGMAKFIKARKSWEKGKESGGVEVNNEAQWEGSGLWETEGEQQAWRDQTFKTRLYFSRLNLWICPSPFQVSFSAKTSFTKPILCKTKIPYLNMHVL